MVIRTRVLLGCKEFPKFVSKQFYELMIGKIALYKYFIPSHLVVERKTRYLTDCRYEVHLDDAKKKPRCHRFRELFREIYQLLPKKDTKMLTVVVEDYCDEYYLLVPGAGYYNTQIYCNWDEKYILYENNVWSIHFREVYVDPHDSSQSIFFTGTPKYQIELCTEMDTRNDLDYLKRAIMAILPRSHLWE
jgi:hypothetical protein